MSSSQGKSVFLIGPGFIGQSVLDLLLDEGYHVTTLSRRKEQAEAFEKRGLRVVMGSLEDGDVIRRVTSENEITFHTATADDLPSVKAVLEGVKDRVKQGKGAIFIHTSGTSVLDDGCHGGFLGDKIYYDDKPEVIDSVPDDAPHRPIDLAIVNAAKEIGDKAKLAIMIPPEIYGFNPAHKRLTIQFPTIARFALKHGYVGHVGKGLAVESQIHVNDLARAYMVLLHHIESSPAAEFLQNPYFFCENGKEFSWREVAEEIGKALHAAGKLKDPEPRVFPEGAYGDLFGAFTPAVIGLNSRSRAVRLRKLGWEPREKEIWDSFNNDELPQILAEGIDLNWAGYKVIAKT